MKILSRIALSLLVLVVVAYMAFIAGLYFFQRNFQYSPEGRLIPLSETLLANVEEIDIPVGGGASVHGWYGAPSQRGKPVILYYKGNTGSFTAEHERYAQWMRDGYGFLAFDYRGFPASPGTITQEHMLQDSVAAYDWLGQANVPIVIWGRSIGTGPATYVASQKEADALLLETPFLSAVTVAGERYPFAPVAWLMQDQFPSNQWIANVTEPVFIAHGTSDTVIDVSNGKRLYALAPNKYQLWIEPNANHGDLWEHGIWARAKQFFETEMQ
jgi:uncharacterized protein